MLSTRINNAQTALDTLELMRQELNTLARSRLMKNVSVTLSIEMMTSKCTLVVTIWNSKQKPLYQNRYLKNFEDAITWINSHA